MYTLILVFWFALSHHNGGAAVQIKTITITGFTSEAECSQEGQKATLKLAPSSKALAEVKWSCIKTK